MELVTTMVVAGAALAAAVVGYVLARKSASGSIQDATAQAEALLKAAKSEAETLVKAAKSEAETLRRSAQSEIETLRRAALIEAKDAVAADRLKLEQQATEHARVQREREAALDERERKIEQRIEKLDERERSLDQRQSELDRIRQRLDRKDEELDAREQKLAEEMAALEAARAQLAADRSQLTARLEQVARMTAAEAKEELLKEVREAAELEAARLAKRLEDEARERAEYTAKKIIATAVQRFSGEYIAERSVSVVPIPDDQMKGRIIGREGRNIRTFELITGTDLIVDETPDAVVVSCHNPLRRENARLTLERLIADGRIQPGRIEEIYQQVTSETEKTIREAGQQAVFDLGLQAMHPELVRLMGINKFRTSYAQNILLHSSEVGFICGMMADELGLDRQLARRCGFLHDIGKAVDHEFEGAHAAIGAELCKKFGESEEVIKAVAEHHDDPPSTIYGVLVQAADTLSAARPGARRETVQSYIKRLEDMEQIAYRHSGVQRAFAIQAGRELRIILDAEKIDDDGAFQVARAVASEIEATLKYPGQIKVTVLRETRATAFAK